MLSDACATAAPEGGVVRGGAPCALAHRKEMVASSRGWPVHGWAGGWDSPDMAQTSQCSHKPLSQAWDGNTDKNTNTPGQAEFLSRQKHVNRAGAKVFFSHRIPQRGIDQDVTQEVVLFIYFSWKFESTTLLPIIRHFRERKKKVVTKGQK